jgi:hypothetical protein
MRRQTLERWKSGRLHSQNARAVKVGARGKDKQGKDNLTEYSGSSYRKCGKNLDTVKDDHRLNNKMKKCCWSPTRAYASCLVSVAKTVH